MISTLATAHKEPATRTTSHALFIIALTFLLDGCSLLQRPAEEPSVTARISWEAHASRLGQLHDWEINGKLGIKTPESTQSAVINRWKQSGDRYEIDLSSSVLGLGSVRLEGTSEYIVIQESGEKPVLSSDPEKLIQDHTHWNLPVRLLPFWIKGLPAPEAPSSHELNANNQLAKLNQAGWTIDYQQYQTLNTISLPTKIVIANGNHKLTFVIKSWNPSH